MKICSTVNRIIVSLLASVVSFWFTMVIIFPHFNKNQSNKNFPRNRMESYNESLFKIRPLYFNKVNQFQEESSLQLFQIVMTNEMPRVIGEGVLIITSEWTHINYNNLMEPILKEYKKRHELSFYLIKQVNNHNYLKYKSMKRHSDQIRYLIQQCIEIKNIKKLTILSYEEGALAALLALSESSLDILMKLDKLILINTFSINHELYQNNFKHISKEIRQNIIKEPAKLFIFQNLRIVMINTFKTAFAEDRKIKKLFDFSFEDEEGVYYQLNQTRVISSKAMWNINGYMRKGIYFHHAAFLSLISAFIIEDSASKFAISQVEYLLRYGQSSAKRESFPQIKEIMARCRTVFLQQLFLEGNHMQLQRGCYRLLIRQRYKFDEVALIFYSHDKIQVYDENYMKVYNSKALPQEGSLYINSLTNLKQINQLIVIAEYRPVNVLMTVIKSPLINPFFQTKERRQRQTLNISHSHQTVLIQSCEGWRPLLGLNQNDKIKELIEVTKDNCYIQIQEDSNNAQWYLYNWQIMRNILVFSLFCSHIFKAKSSSQYYLQFIIIVMILYFFLNRLYILQTLIALSFAVLTQSFSKIFVKISLQFNITGFNYWFTIVFPLISQIIGKVNIGELQFNKSSNKLLWIQISMINHESGYIITLIKCYLMQDYYDTNHSCIYPLVLLILWQLWNTPSIYTRFSTPLATNKKKMADIIYLFILCLNLIEEGVVPQIIDYYILTHLLLALGEIINTVVAHPPLQPPLN